MSRPLAAMLLLVLALAACGDDGARPIFDTSGTTSATLGDTTSSSTTPTTTTPATTTTLPETTTTTEPSPLDDLFTEIVEGPVAAPHDPTESGIGSSDPDAAAAIQTSVGTADLPGSLFQVFDVLGTDDRLLVVTLDQATVDAAGDEAGNTFLLAVLDSPAVGEHGITRFVFNYRGSDDAGEYVVTSTVSVQDALAAQAAGESITPYLTVQLTRDGQVVTE